MSQRQPVLPITSHALALIKHWLDQPLSVAEPELLLCDPPSWVVGPKVTVLDEKPAIIFNIMANLGQISPEIVIDPSGFAVLRLLTALGAASMVDCRSKEGRPYVKVFSDEPSSGISLRRILSGVSEEEVATALENPLDYRACVTGFQRGSRRDHVDQSDALAVALKRYGANTPVTLGFQSHQDYQDLILRAFERHWEHQDRGAPMNNTA